MGFMERTDDDGLPQELASYYETHNPGDERGQGLPGPGVNPHFPENFGMSINRSVTICQEETTLQRLSQLNSKLSYKQAS